MIIPVVALKSNLDAAVILEELNLVATCTAAFFNLLKEVLTVQPHHFYRVELDSHLPGFLIRHTNLYLIVKAQLWDILTIKHNHLANLFLGASSYPSPLRLRI